MAVNIQLHFTWRGREVRKDGRSEKTDDTNCRRISKEGKIWQLMAGKRDE